MPIKRNITMESILKSSFHNEDVEVKALPVEDQSSDDEI